MVIVTGVDDDELAYIFCNQLLYKLMKVLYC